MNIEDLINTVGDLGDCPDMYHPDYGWLRKDGKTTQEGLNYFEDQLEKFNPVKVGCC